MGTRAGLRSGDLVFTGDAYMRWVDAYKLWRRLFLSAVVVNTDNRYDADTHTDQEDTTSKSVSRTLPFFFPSIIYSLSEHLFELGAAMGLFKGVAKCGTVPCFEVHQSLRHTVAHFWGRKYLKSRRKISE